MVLSQVYNLVWTQSCEICKLFHFRNTEIAQPLDFFFFKFSFLLVPCKHITRNSLSLAGWQPLHEGCCTARGQLCTLTWSTGLNTANKGHLRHSLTQSLGLFYSLYSQQRQLPVPAVKIFIRFLPQDSNKGSVSLGCWGQCSAVRGSQTIYTIFFSLSFHTPL